MLDAGGGACSRLTGAASVLSRYDNTNNCKTRTRKESDGRQWTSDREQLLLTRRRGIEERPGAASAGTPLRSLGYWRVGTERPEAWYQE